MSQTISQRAAEIALQQMPKGREKHCPTCGQLKPAPRNVERHKLFFAVLKPALEQWPEAFEFQPLSTEHLRAWLLYRVGHCTTRDLEIGGPSKANAVAAVRFFLAGESQSKFYTSTAKGIREYTPKSIAFHKCSESQFKTVLDAAGALIESIIGVPIEALKREHAA